MNFRNAAFAIVLVSVAAPASAATFCVGTSDELSAALLAAQQNSADSNRIRIRAGHYLAPAGGWHVDVQHRGITISGGSLDADCQTDALDASFTELDGHQEVPVLTIDTSFVDFQQTGGEILISGLTFENGMGDRAGGLKISDGGPIYNGAIRVERNIFRNNTSTVYEEENSAGALLAATDGSTNDGQTFLIVRDNLFVGNRANDAAAATLFSNNTIAVNNNTFVGNQATDPALAVRAAVTWFSGTGIFFDSNIFWSNNPDGLDGTYDVRANILHADSLPHASLFNNDVQSVFSTPAAQGGNVGIDPVFVDRANGDFHLASTSPLIDAGLDSPATGEIGVFDLDGVMRLQGKHVDIGAYERNPEFVFQNGFD